MSTIDLVPGVCSFCGNNRVLPRKNAIEFCDFIPNAFFKNDKGKTIKFTNSKKNVKLCINCVVKLEKCNKFKTQCEKNKKQPMKRRSLSGNDSLRNCFFCDTKQNKFVKTEEFIKQIEVFAVATNLLSADKQRVICTSCVFELHLWCEMEQLISKTFEVWKQNEKTAEKSSRKSSVSNGRNKRINSTKNTELVESSDGEFESQTDAAGKHKQKTPEPNKVFYKIDLSRKNKVSFNSKRKYCCGVCKKTFSLLHQYNKHKSCHSKQKSVKVNLFRYNLPVTARASEFLKEKRRREQAEKRLEEINERASVKEEELSTERRTRRTTDQIPEKRLRKQSAAEKRSVAETSTRSRRVLKRKPESDEKEDCKRLKLTKTKAANSNPKKNKSTIKKNGVRNKRKRNSPAEAENENRTGRKRAKVGKTDSSSDELNDNETEMKNQRNRRTSVEQSPENLCTTCNATFSLLYEYKKHLLTHDENPLNISVNLMKFQLPPTVNVFEFITNHPDKFSKEYKLKTIADDLLKKYDGDVNVEKEDKINNIESDNVQTDVLNEENSKIEKEIVENEENVADVSPVENEGEANDQVSEVEESESAKEVTTAPESDVEDVFEKLKKTSIDENNKTTPQLSEDDNEIGDKQAVEENEAQREIDDEKIEDGRKDEDEKNENHQVDKEEKIEEQQEQPRNNPIISNESTHEVINETETAAILETTSDERNKVVDIEENRSNHNVGDVTDIFTTTLLKEVNGDEEQSVKTNNGLSDDTVKSADCTDLIEDISSISNYIRESMITSVEQECKRNDHDDDDLCVAAQPKKKVRFALDSDDSSLEGEGNNDYNLLMNNS